MADIASKTDLKLQLLECLKCVNLEAPMIRSQSAPDTTTEEEDADNGSLLNANQQYADEIEWEEQAMIKRLYEWIEQQGKPAQARADALQLQCDGYVDEISNLKSQTATLQDELDKVNLEKQTLESKNTDLIANSSELQETLSKLHSTRSQHVQQEVAQHDEEHTDRIKAYESDIQKLTQQVTDLQQETKNLQTISDNFEQQQLVLNQKLEQKEATITQLTEERDAWEAKHDETNRDLLQRLQQINSLSTENANFKHQIALLQSGKQSSGQLAVTQNKTLRNMFAQSSGDVLGGSETDIAAAGGGHQYKASDTQGLNNLDFYAVSATNIYPEQYEASVLKLAGKDSVDVPERDAAMLQKEVKELQLRLTEQKDRHLTEMEAQEMAIEKERKEKEDREADLQKLQDENKQLKLLTEQQSSGCDKCLVM